MNTITPGMAACASELKSAILYVEADGRVGAYSKIENAIECLYAEMTSVERETLRYRLATLLDHTLTGEKYSRCGESAKT